MARSRRLGEAATLIRPLLGVRRAEVIAYLADLGQPYRTDATNEDTRLTRNRIRHELLPMLADRFNPRVAEALLRLGSLADEASTLIETVVDDLAARCVRENGPGVVRIDLVPLAGQPRYVVRELLVATWRAQSWPMRSMGYAEWDALAAMALGSGPKTRTYPGNISATADSEALVLCRSRTNRSHAPSPSGRGSG
jgi:tRNA(Ile)-lysidine synthase